MKNVVILTGAGISKAANLPLANEINDKILSGKGIARYTGGWYYFGRSNFEHMGKPDFDVKRVSSFIRYLYDDINKTFPNRKRQINYEDLYNIIYQLKSLDSNDNDDIAVAKYIVDKRKDIEDFLKLQDVAFDHEYDLYRLLDESMHYIKDVVISLVSNPSKDLYYLSVFGEIIKDSSISNITMVTLNHDKLLDNYFYHNGVNFIDGFDDSMGKIHPFNPDLFDNPKARLKLIKLHGSIGWYRFRCYKKNTNIGFDYYGKTNEQVSRGVYTNDGAQHDAINNRSHILVGTINKIIEYTQNIFLDLFIEFYKNLRKSDNLLISGYSFGDKAINVKIVEWLYGNPKSKIVIIDPYLDDLKKYSRPEIYINWDKFKNESKIITIEDKIENVVYEQSWFK